MFSPQITAILKRQLFFLGTICEGTPRVRPMRPFVDAEDNIWLISYKGTEKNKEIELNNKVELCTVDNNDVLRLQGFLLQEKDSAPASSIAPSIGVLSSETISPTTASPRCMDALIQFILFSVTKSLV